MIERGDHLPSPMRTRHFRVDPRLIHATLMNAWVPALEASHVVIVDRDVAGDPRTRTIFEISAMDLVSIHFVREERAPEVLARIPESETAFVLFSSLEGAERALASGLAMDHLNIGHLPEARMRSRILPAVHLGPSDLEIVGRLMAVGTRVFVQPLPRDEPLSPFHRAAPEEAPRETTSSLPSPGEKRRGSITRPRSGATIERIEERLEVVNERGLHLRAAHMLADLAARLTEDVRVGRAGEFVNAKSLLGLTTLGATRGTFLDVVVTGPDAKGAMEAIRTLFASGFEECGSGPAPAARADEP